jgi:hypothetical protein
MFLGLLQALRPQGEFLPLLRAAVEGVWKERNRAQQEMIAAIHRRIEQLENRKQKIFDTSIDGKITQETYGSQTGIVGTLIDEARASEPEDPLSEEEVSSLLLFVDWFLNRARVIWNAASARDKGEIQAALVPAGVIVGPEGFQTPKPTFIFKQLESEFQEGEDLASPGGFEPSYGNIG